MPWLMSENNYCLLQVKVKPGSHRDQIIVIQHDRLVITLRAKALEGAANKALIEFLLEALNIAKCDLEILKGDQAKFKLIKVNLSATLLQDKVSAFCKVG